MTSMKQPGICETLDGVRSYSGYVHLPPNSLTEPNEEQNYPINTSVFPILRFCSYNSFIADIAQDFSGSL